MRQNMVINLIVFCKKSKIMKTKNVLAKCIAIMCAVVWSGVGSVGFAQTPSVSPEKNIAEDMGELHNKGVYEFMEYLKNQGLNKDTDKKKIDSLINVFTINFIDQQLKDYQNELDSISQQDISESQLMEIIPSLVEFQKELETIIDTSTSTEEIDKRILLLLDEYKTKFPNKHEFILFDVIGNIARASNSLWGGEWKNEDFPLK